MERRPAASKLWESADQAVADIPSRARLAVGGFGVVGVPFTLIQALGSAGVADLTVYSNNLGIDGVGLGVLLSNRQISSVIASYVGENKAFEQLYLSGQLNVELVPQGTLAERLRAGGAGIPAFYTRSGAGTVLTDTRETREFDGNTCVLERAVIADFALVRAWRGDHLGNLVYRRTARNFNPLAAMAGRTTIAEVEELVEVGELDGDLIHTPAAFVQRVVRASPDPKTIERLTTKPS
ncbi:MAG TPA: CoA transferase subunit A [Solirubrobacteraceae bacterium]|jgi:3-oxoacid CoA-transferase subunit A|nr:CoA transferase subunit A [Solirubrobacteraceae bacterium]